MKFTRNQIVIVAGALFLILIFVVILIFFRRTPANTGLLSGDLIVWGVFDSEADFRSMLARYNQFQPNVRITYIEKNPVTYEQELLNALATPNAPDIVMVHNTWLPKHFDKLQPLTSSAMSIEEYKQTFPDVVVQDFAPDGTIYATPLYIDTLALYYNKDIFDKEGVAVPPSNWQEFQNIVSKVRVVDSGTGQIKQAAAAIGGTNNSINRATDLLSLVMLQSGTKMVGGSADNPTFASDQGVNAMNFYTSFASPGSPYYTWDEAFTYSLDGFSSEDVAMMFNYQYQSEFLKQKNPFLDFDITPMLQPASAETTVNYANYWGLAVVAKSQKWQLAWRFLLDFIRNPELSELYLESSGRPPAHRALINKYVSDPNVGVFARQALTARSWPQTDNILVENSLSNAIRQVLGGRGPAESLLEAQSAIAR